MTDQIARPGRRLFLRGAAASVLGCSAAASPWLTSVTLAGGAPGFGDRRMVVVILRGAMDGLDVLRPAGDPLFARYRPKLSQEDGIALDPFWALHPKLAGLQPLWQKGELGFVHATSTPYRNKRSHFDGQDILEAGTGLDVPQPEVRDGWLNRMLQVVPGLRSETAWAIGREALPVLSGDGRHRSWAPDQQLAISPQAQRLLEQICHEDELFRDAAMQAIELSAELRDEAQMSAGSARGRLGEVGELASFAAGRLRGEARIAAFSLAGWDTHRGQKAAIGGSLSRLEHLLLTLRADLGGIWDQTLVLAMTEFGRTVAENGVGGTDHGTGGAMLMAGGALRGGQVFGRWPGLDEAALFDRRDLMPTSDVRDWAAWAMHGMFGLDRGLLQSAVFPGLDMGPDPHLLL